MIHHFIYKHPEPVEPMRESRCLSLVAMPRLVEIHIGRVSGVSSWVVFGCVWQQTGFRYERI